MALTFLLVVGDASAESTHQSIVLGMTTEEVKAALSDAKELPVVGAPNYLMITSGARRITIGLCRGRVDWISSDLGTGLSDFVYQVKEGERKFGSPKYSTYQARGQQGEQSYVTATWPTNFGSISVRHGLTPWNGEFVSLVTSAHLTDEAIRGCV